MFLRNKADLRLLNHCFQSSAKQKDNLPRRFLSRSDMKKPRAEPSYPTEIIREGTSKFRVPRLSAYVKSPSDYAPSKAPVFYNPVMELNRDMAVLALQAYRRMTDHDLSVCEPLASGGIRGIRFTCEVQGVNKTSLTDINSRAVQAIRHNARLNKTGKRLLVEHADANLFLSQHSAPHMRFDAVDIDPFGSPVPFLDSAIRALRDEGMLALTATDMAPLCGVHPKACLRKYGGKPLRTEYCHELGVRLLAGCLTTMAAKHEMGMKPLFGHSTNHYARLYAQVEHGAKNADESLRHMGYVAHCFNCLHRHAVSTITPGEESIVCPECGSPLSYGGPLWLGPLFDKKFCKRMLKELTKKKLNQRKRIEGILKLAIKESEAPLSYFVIDKISDKLNTRVPPVAKVAELLRENHFDATLTCFSPKALRTNAPSKSVTSLVLKAITMDC